MLCPVRNGSMRKFTSLLSCSGDLRWCARSTGAEVVAGEFDLRCSPAKYQYFGQQDEACAERKKLLGRQRS